MFISQQDAQSIVEEVKAAIGRDINIMDETGRILASTNPARQGQPHPAAERILREQLPSLTVEEDQPEAGMQAGINLPVRIDGAAAGVIGITGPPEEVAGFGSVIKLLTEILVERARKNQQADRLERAECIGRSGMFLSYSGWYKGAHVTVVSGGSGSPEMELALFDYMENTGAHTYLRVGGSGGIGTDVHPGDVVISSGVVRAEGMTKAYIPAEFPAVSHYEVVNAMAMAADRLGASYHVGVTLSIDSDVIGCGRPAVGGYLQPWNLDVLGIYNRAGVLNGDRESAAVVTLSALFDRRGGSVCSVSDNAVTGEKFQEGVAKNIEIDIALEGCAILQQMDAVKGGSPYWHPGIGL